MAGRGEPDEVQPEIPVASGGGGDIPPELDQSGEGENPERRFVPVGLAVGAAWSWRLLVIGAGRGRGPLPAQPGHHGDHPRRHLLPPRRDAPAARGLADAPRLEQVPRLDPHAHRRARRRQRDPHLRRAAVHRGHPRLLRLDPHRPQGRPGLARIRSVGPRRRAGRRDPRGHSGEHHQLVQREPADDRPNRTRRRRVDRLRSGQLRRRTLPGPLHHLLLHPRRPQDLDVPHRDAPAHRLRAAALRRRRRLVDPRAVHAHHRGRRRRRRHLHRPGPVPPRRSRCGCR